MALRDLLLAPLAAFVLTVLLILILKPLLARYAMARPNARSSHTVPTPQGGGIAIMIAILIVVSAGLVLLRWVPEPGSLVLPRGTLAGVLAAAVVLALAGAIDDIRPLPALPRLTLQFLAVLMVIGPTPLRLFPDLVPAWLETALLVLAGVWFVNLVNFMDGLDWMTVAEMVPITGFLMGLGLHLGGVPLFDPAGVPLLAGALCGGLVGFALFNKPVARLFLGDVGSLPIGLIVGWCLLQLAGTGALVAALLLPLYYLADATITLGRRLARREKVWEAHRTHFYQRATDRGFTALGVSAHVFGLNLVLAVLAAVTLAYPSLSVQIASLLAGSVLTGLLLFRFSRRHPEPVR
ncbi:glycosyl transferase [Microvirga antarctica]|uniref:glycosyl transferase n=1 Tax=Microvirga antarctica TaxID=2819233 RepID=UPI001B3165F0|nr:glycosyl transferase [Microvirga antarctica]